MKQSPREIRQIARGVLRRVWIEKHIITTDEHLLLTRASVGLDETVLDTCARLAEIDLKGVKAYDSAEVARRLQLAEALTTAAARDREKANDA